MIEEYDRAKKKGLDAYYDKRWLAPDGIHTYPFGYDPDWRRKQKPKLPIEVRLDLNMKTRSAQHKLTYELGCNMDDFMKHIESRFVVGMCWRNYGKVWNLEHIIPVSYCERKEFKNKAADGQEKIRAEITHHMNIKPLMVADNSRKNNNITEDVKQRLNIVCGG